MKFVVEDQGQSHEIQFQRSDREVTAAVDGREYRFELTGLPDGGYLLSHEGRVQECRVDPVPGNPDLRRVVIGSREFEFMVRDPRRLARDRGVAGGEGATQLVAMMPGKIVGILCEVGQEVAAGEPVLVVEAMKMQNEMKSSRAGAIREIRVAIGDTVNSGDILAVIE